MLAVASFLWWQLVFGGPLALSCQHPCFTHALEHPQTKTVACYHIQHAADTSWGPVNSQIALVCQWTAWRHGGLFILVLSSLLWCLWLVSHVLSVSSRLFGLVHSAQPIQLAWRTSPSKSADSICWTPQGIKWSLGLLMINSIISYLRRSWMLLGPHALSPHVYILLNNPLVSANHLVLHTFLCGLWVSSVRFHSYTKCQNMSKMGKACKRKAFNFIRINYTVFKKRPSSHSLWINDGKRNKLSHPILWCSTDVHFWRWSWWYFSSNLKASRTLTLVGKTICRIMHKNDVSDTKRGRSPLRWNGWKMTNACVAFKQVALFLQPLMVMYES